MTRPVSRRQFLLRSTTIGGGVLGVAALGGGAGLLSGCGRTMQAPDVVALYNPDRVLAAGRPQRIPFALLDPGVDGGEVALPADDQPVTVELMADGEVIERQEIVGHVVAHDHVGDVGDHEHSDLYRYYPARLTMPEPGIYDLVVTMPGGGGFSEPPATTLVVQAFDPSEVTVPLPGQPMPAVATPTVADPSGIDRLCTRPEQCPFHEVSFADVVGRGRPSALLVATPAFCSTAYCGPVLDTLIEASAANPAVAVVHAEVYANPDEVDGNFADPAIRLAPAVEALGLTFEPSLFLVSSDGTLTDRIDNVFDLTEATEALRSLT